MNKNSRLAVEYAEGHSDGTELLQAFDRLVWRIVLSRWGDVEDLFQEGRLAVLDAAHRYDPSKGTEFNTFVFHRITAAVNDAGVCYMGSGPDIKPRNYRTYRQAQRLSDTEDITHQEAARRLGLSIKAYLAIHNALSPAQISGVDLPAPEHDTVSADFVDFVLSHIEDTRERQLFSMFYGCHDGQTRTAEELSKLVGDMTTQEVRNSLQRSRRRLRRIMGQMDY